MSDPSQPASIQTQAPYSQTQAPYSQTPIAAAPPAPSSRSSATTVGLPWFIIGATLLIVGLMQAVPIPEMTKYKSSDAVVGNLTGVVALFGIGAALLAVGFMKRRQQR